MPSEWYVANSEYEDGSLIYFEDNVAVELPIGNNDKFLASESGVPVWKEISPSSGLPHAQTHSTSGSDPVQLDISQITDLAISLENLYNEILLASGNLSDEIALTSGDLLDLIISTSGNLVDLVASTSGDLADLITSTSDTEAQVSGLVADLASKADASGFVPYTGATSNVNLGSHAITANRVEVNASGLQFNISATPIDSVPGQLQWNATEGTIDIGLNEDVTLQVGQEQTVLCKNQTGSDIANGTPVMYAGAIGASGRMEVMPAIADGTYLAAMTMGIATENIANGDDGYVTWFGKIRGIQTDGVNYGETWTDGDILYVGLTSGALTNVKPDAPYEIIPIAVVINAHQTTGTLFVRPSWHCSFTDLTDVDGVTPTHLPFMDSDFIIKDSPISITSSGNIDVSGHRIVNVSTPLASGDATTKGYTDSLVSSLSSVIGSGYVPYIGAVTDVNLGNFKLLASGIGVGVTSPAEMLDVYGNIRVKKLNTNTYIQMYDNNNDPYLIYAIGGSLQLSYGSPRGATFFNDGTSNPSLLIYGKDSGAGVKKYGSLRIETDGTFNVRAQAGEALALGGNNTTAITADASGNVGVGTTTPSYKLDVSGTGRFTGQLTSTLATGTSPLAVTSTTVNTNLNADLLDNQHGSYYTGYTDSRVETLASGITASGYVVGPSSATSNAIPRYNGTTGKLIKNSSAVLTDDGKLGVNYALPGEALHVNGNGRFESLLGSGAHIYIYGPDGMSQELKTYNGFLGIGAAGAQTLNITNTGYVGIGTYTPSAKLAVAGNVTSSGSYISTVASGTAPISVVSSTLNTNLNADLLDGQHGSFYTDYTDNAVTAALSGVTASGYVVGPSSATDNAIPRYDSTTGKLIKDSGITIDDIGDLFLSDGSFIQSNKLLGYHRGGTWGEAQLISNTGASGVIGATYVNGTPGTSYKSGPLWLIGGPDPAQSDEYPQIFMFSTGKVYVDCDGGFQFAPHPAPVSGSGYDTSLYTGIAWEVTSEAAGPETVQGIWMSHDDYDSTYNKKGLWFDDGAGIYGLPTPTTSGSPATKIYTDDLFAVVSGDLSTHISDTNNPHNVTYEQVGADPSGAAAAVLAEIESSGFIQGPASSTDNAIVKYNGASGKLAKNSGITIDANNNITLPMPGGGSTVSIIGPHGSPICGYWNGPNWIQLGYATQPDNATIIWGRMEAAGVGYDPTEQGGAIVSTGEWDIDVDGGTLWKVLPYVVDPSGLNGTGIAWKILTKEDTPRTLIETRAWPGVGADEWLGMKFFDTASSGVVLDMNQVPIINVPTPVSSGDAVNKGYLESTIADASGNIVSGITIESIGADPAGAAEEVHNAILESGYVVGPGSSTDNAIARYNGTTGRLVQDSSITIADNGQLISTVSTGTSPFDVASTTLNANLNADLLDGQHGSYYGTATDVSGNAASIVSLSAGLTGHVNNTSNPHSVTIAQISGEPVLGNPTNDNDVLTSTASGVRSWTNNMELHNPRLYWEVGPEDFFNPSFLGTSQLKDWVYWGNGTNGKDISGESGQYGGYYMYTNCASSSNFTSIHVYGQALRWGKGEINFISRFKLRQLSTSSNQFRARTGISWNWPDYAGDPGCYFRYREDENSGNWSAVLDNGSSDTYRVDTGVAGDTSWHVFEIKVNADATLATFYIDYVQVAQFDPHTGFPANRRTDAWAILLCGRGTGSNTVSCDIDYSWVWGKKDLTYAP